MIRFDFGVRISTSTISDKLIGMLYTLKQRTQGRAKKGKRATHDDLVLLGLAPYSPMCNPIEGCFSVLKACIKVHLAL
eukprot:jgi/Phyca11/83104/gw1.2.1358.1